MEDRKARLAALAFRAGRNSGGSSSSATVIGTFATAPEKDKISEPPEEEEKMEDGKVGNSLAVKKQAPALKFRNYTPTAGGSGEGGSPEESALDSSKKRSRGADPASNDESPTTASNKKKKSSSALETALEKASSEAATAVPVTSSEGGGTTTAVGAVAVAAPQKANWDLKRDIRSKLQRLEKRTQRALVELLRERLEQDASDAAAAGEDGANEGEAAAAAADLD
jgi:coiled-coil domain-containing protein 12